MVNDWPSQIEPLLTEMVGIGSTLMVAIAASALTQPSVLVPTTE